PLKFPGELRNRILVWARTPASRLLAILEVGMVTAVMPPGFALWANPVFAQAANSVAAIASDAVECLIFIEILLCIEILLLCFRASRQAAFFHWERKPLGSG